MKTFKEILVTPFEAHQPILWHNLPLQQYHPRIKGYLSAKLGKEFVGLLALPKITTGKDGKKIISWLTDELERPLVTLEDWKGRADGNTPLQHAEKVKKQLAEHINNLLASSVAAERTWGQMLSLCLEGITDAFIFVEAEKVVIAGWGLKSIDANDTSAFSALIVPKPKPSSPPEDQSDEVLIDDTTDDNLNTAPATPNENTEQEAAALSFDSALEEPLIEPIQENSSNVAAKTESEEKDSINPVVDLTNTPSSSEQEENFIENSKAQTESKEAVQEIQEQESSGDGATSDAGSPPPNKPPNKTPNGFIGFFRRWWWLLLLLLFLALIFWQMCSRSSGVAVLPDNPNVIVPIDSSDVVVDEDSIKMIVSDRLNIALRGANKDIQAFAKAFKSAYPDPNYEIIYYDTLTKRLQIKIPMEKRGQMIEELHRTLPSFEMLIWHESIFSREKLPTDPGYQDQSISWYIDAIKAPGAWDKSFGDKKVIVAIIDDGFDLQHPEFAGKIVKPWNVLDRSKNVFSSQKLIHGSHVAGTAIANKNNRTGISGIAPDCSFMPIQVADANGLMSSTAIIDGILYAINQGADVINLSLGLKTLPIVATYPLHVQRDIIANTAKAEEKFWDEIFSIADENGVTVVLAGGNENVLIGIDPMQRSPYTINIAALTPELQKADFSNFGDYSTLSAPGVGIYSSVPNNRYQFMDGTSMASPIVTGAVALIKSIKPSLKPKEIKNLLINTGVFISNEVGPLLQLSQAIASVNDSNAISDPEAIDCETIQQKIDSLLKEVERLQRMCPDAGSADTMKMPEVIENLDFSIGRWKSTTSIHNDTGQEITIYFDFFPNQQGKLTLVEPGGLECTAQLSLRANQRSFDVNQLQEALCAYNQGGYSKYTFACQADAKGYAQCIAQNKSVKVNRFSFKLVKIN